MGRKKMVKKDEKIDVRLRVDADLQGRMQAEADKEGNSIAAFVRTAVVRELARRAQEGGK